MAGDNKLSVSRVNPSASTAITFAAWDNNSWDVAARLVAERSRSLGAAVLAGAGGMFASADVAPAVNVAADLVEEPDAASISDTVAAARRAQLLLQAVVVPGEGTPEGQIIEAVTLPWYDIIDAILRDLDTVYEISPRKWEEIIAGAYERAGFDKVTLTPHSGDLGRDVIAIKKGLGEVRVIDQVKAFKPPHLVTAHDVQALMGVLQTDGAAKGFITTTSDFAPKIPTNPLIAPFIGSRLDLINGRMLIERLRELAKKRGD
jgi:restriction system protein